MKQRNYFIFPYVIFLGVFIILPMLLILSKSFYNLDGVFSLENYTKIFTPVYLLLMFNSFKYAFLITLFCVIIGYPAAYFLMRTKHKRLWLSLILLPMWMNLLLKIYAFIGIFAREGLLNGLLGLVGAGPFQFLFTDVGFLIVSVYLFIPFMVMPIFNSIEKISPSLFDAASDLGAGRLRTFWRVIVPLTKEGIKSGIQVVFIPSLSLFFLTRLIGGNKIITLGTAIEQNFLVAQNYGVGSAIAVVLIIMMFLLMFLLNRLLKTKGGR